MFYFVLAAVVLVALVLIFRDDHDRRYDQRGGSERQYLAEKPAPRPELRTNARKTMEADIAGLRYYCSLVDIGPISGVVRAEPDNAHDPRACSRPSQRKARLFGPSWPYTVFHP